MLLGTNAAVRADSVELVLVRCRVFHKSAVRPEDVSDAPTIALNNLGHVRSQPHSCARNLELCDSVDAAETELAGLGNAVLVETGNGAAALLEQLTARLARSNTTLLLGRQPGAGAQQQQPVGLVGEIELSRGFPLAQATAALELSRECGGAPVLFVATGGFDLQDLDALSELVAAAAVPCMLAGVWHQPSLYHAAFASTRFLVVVDPRGYGLDSDLEDGQLAERCLPLLQQACSRLVLGVNFSHAVQLRRYGGDGYAHAVRRFVARLRALGASPSQLQCLCKTNALQALQYRQPVVVREVAPTRAPWLCETCGASRLQGDEYFESHGKRFCRAKCMREFRLVHGAPLGRDDGFGGGPAKPSSTGTGNWGVSL